MYEHRNALSHVRVRSIIVQKSLEASTGDVDIRLIDFGTATEKCYGLVDLIGTREYMPPE